jgi:hypothetical protein
MAWDSLHSQSQEQGYRLLVTKSLALTTRWHGGYQLTVVEPLVTCAARADATMLVKSAGRGYWSRNWNFDGS